MAQKTENEECINISNKVYNVKNIYLLDDPINILPPPPLPMLEMSPKQVVVDVVSPSEEDDEFSTKKAVVNRCSGCRKKVGLTGFTCRCNQLFCSEHRYSDRHDCSYDYKSAGREMIKRNNPVVKASKIVRI